MGIDWRRFKPDYRQGGTSCRGAFVSRRFRLFRTGALPPGGCPGERVSHRASFSRLGEGCCVLRIAIGAFHSLAQYRTDSRLRRLANAVRCRCGLARGLGVARLCRACFWLAWRCLGCVSVDLAGECGFSLLFPGCGYNESARRDRTVRLTCNGEQDTKWCTSARCRGADGFLCRPALLSLLCSIPFPQRTRAKLEPVQTRRLGAPLRAGLRLACRGPFAPANGEIFRSCGDVVICGGVSQR